MTGKVLCVIDHFGSGGAQRQMVELACGLKAAGHEVHAFVYYPDLDFFRPRIDEAGIAVHAVAKGRGFSPKVLWALRRLIAVERFDAVVSFLDRPNVYAELACRLSPHRPRLIVSERSHRRHDIHTMGAALRRRLHGWADGVVANSEHHARWLRTLPGFAGKVHCIYNGFDLSRFSMPAPPRPQPPMLRLLAIGRVGVEKNPRLLIEALRRHQARHGWVPQVAWVGRRDDTPAGREHGRQVDEALAAAPEVARAWRWLGERSDIAQLLADAQALVHPALYEGLPNVVCEALCAGRPVLASDVGDHAVLIGDGQRGRLFDPHDADSLLAAIESLHDPAPDVWSGLCASALAFARQRLPAAAMVGRYEALLGLAGPTREPADAEV